MISDKDREWRRERERKGFEVYRIEGSWGNFPAICRMGFFLGEGINLNSSALDFFFASS